VAGGGLLVVSELLDWIGGRSAWEFFHGIDVALLVLGLGAAALGASSLAGRPARPPFQPGAALAACGTIVTTIVLLFVDTSSASAGAYLGLIAALSILAGGLLLGARTEHRSTSPSPPGVGEAPPLPGFYPDPRGEARMRFWDGAGWSEQTRD
jgi:uncharacterized protein DUF2510